MENEKKRQKASAVTAPSTSADRLVKRESKKQSKASYRIVFTMKRMITARPTQPHITPITMAVTSPAGGRGKRRDTSESAQLDYGTYCTVEI